MGHFWGKTTGDVPLTIGSLVGQQQHEWYGNSQINYVDSTIRQNPVRNYGRNTEQNGQWSLGTFNSIRSTEYENNKTGT